LLTDIHFTAHALPVAIAVTTSVPYKASFILVGGDSELSVSTIYLFDIASEDWILQEEQLSVANYWVSAMLVSTDLFPACIN
jgi:hypothetical protein